ncbi:6-phosphogluconolactonase [Lysobacter niastensis]|uniref:6-phosphogluconolactonase n=1 Tax=Lysobacter niastensis TaxID=380629 RepID=A0ABS0B3V8_9GAMM|nr:6-phosphogluconolactonase [Lysobacter niastensis]
MPLSEHVFDDGASLATALAKAVAADLRGAIARRGKARLAVSGGSTPRAFLCELSKQTLDWAHVTVVPVDDRWVAPDHPRSNERLLRETLFQGAAAKAQLLPLRRPAPTPESALLPVLTQVANEGLPLDVAVLGMGEDGHVASLFPDLARRDIGLQSSGRAPVLAIRSASAPEPRITLTLSAIFTAPSLYLHIEGAKKRAVLENAARDPRSTLPIRSVLAGAPVTPSLYWSP